MRIGEFEVIIGGGDLTPIRRIVLTPQPGNPVPSRGDEIELDGMRLRVVRVAHQAEAREAQRARRRYVHTVVFVKLVGARERVARRRT